MGKGTVGLRLTMETLLAYAQSLNASQEVLNWLSTTGNASLKKNLTNVSALEHIVDFLVSNAAPKRLQKLSIADAQRLTNKWSTGNQKKGKNLTDTVEDIRVIHDFLDGTKIVELKTKKALEREGFLMSHCVGGYSLSNEVQIFSYRDHENNPHATFEVRKKGTEIVQIKGKGNGTIHPKYIHPILTFLQTLGKEVRPSEMQNLGYYFVDPVHQTFLMERDLLNRTIVLFGNTYAY